MDEHLIVTSVSAIDTDVKHEARKFYIYVHKDTYNLLTTRHLETSLLRLKNKKMAHLSLSLALAGRVIFASKKQRNLKHKQSNSNTR